MKNKGIEVKDRASEIITLDEWIETELPGQYKEKIELLNSLGFLSIISGDQLGIVGFNGREYPLPKEGEIEETLKRKEELREKFTQGFTELEITPLGLPIHFLIEILKKTLIEHAQKDKFFALQKDLSNPQEEPISLKLSSEGPVQFTKHSGLRNENVDEKIRYWTKRGLVTKEFLLDNVNNRFPGFNVYLREANPYIPLTNKSQEIRTLKLTGMVTGISPETYLKILQKNINHSRETVKTLEDELVLTTTYLASKNQLDCYPSYDMTSGGGYPGKIILGSWTINASEIPLVIIMGFAGSVGKLVLTAEDKGFINEKLGARFIVKL